MATPTEKRISRERRSRAEGSKLILILEELLENECQPDDDEDFRFLDMLLRARQLPREEGVFSPSMLGSCMRQAFFAKMGEEKHKAQSPQTNGYFLNGNFLHLKWQFALWKAHRAGLLELVSVRAENESLDFNGDGTRPAVELRVRSSSGDFAGTIDAIIRIGKRYYVVDFKGINLVEYQRTLKRGTKDDYKVQIVGYAMIVNGSDEFEFRIKTCLLISECKAGPLSSGRGSPLALHESAIDVDDYKAQVRERLGKLRGHVERDERPEPACVSTQHMAYMECPFNRYCHGEVRERQRIREAEARAKMRNRGFTVSRP